MIKFMEIPFVRRMLGLAPLPGTDVTEEGMDAFKRGDCASAARRFRRAAISGNAKAQGYLGLLYERGEGVSQDYAEAAKWFRLSADQGYAMAQYRLGLLCLHGYGVVRDEVEALTWFKLASDRGHVYAQTKRGCVAENMTAEQIAAADLRAVEWQLSQ